MKKIYVTVAILAMSLIANAQSNTVGTGGDATGTGGSVSYSVGQIDYTNNSGSNGDSNEGVQQPYEFFEFVGLDEHSLITTSLYPNPTNDFVLLSIETVKEELSYSLYDQRGRLINNGDITESTTSIDVSELAAGDYHLTISQASTQIESIKIVKY